MTHEKLPAVLYMHGFYSCYTCNVRIPTLVDSFGKHFSLSGDHTESLEIHYDPTVTSYSGLLKIFWENHDSTRCASRQYMSAIFYHNEEQKKLAESTRDAKQKTLSKKIVTRITEVETFYDAEE